MRLEVDLTDEEAADIRRVAKVTLAKEAVIFPTTRASLEKLVAALKPPSKHDALRADFLALIRERGYGSDTAKATKFADRLVHIVVLHKLLPEAV